MAAALRAVVGCSVTGGSTGSLFTALSPLTALTALSPLTALTALTALSTVFHALTALSPLSLVCAVFFPLNAVLFILPATALGVSLARTLFLFLAGGTVVYVDFNAIEGGNWFSTFSGRGRKGKKCCKGDD
jgi:hypothetical protein